LLSLKGFLEDLPGNLWLWSRNCAKR